MTDVSFLVCPLRVATICSVVLLKTIAVLSLPPVTILLESLALMSNVVIPDTLALCRPLNK